MNALTQNLAADPVHQATTTHPDAGLFALIAEFETFRSRHGTEFESLKRLPKRHPDYKQRWATWQAESDQYRLMERHIVCTRSSTIEGAMAKARLGADILTEGETESLADNPNGFCRAWAVATTGIYELLHGGPVDPDADRLLLELHAELRQAVAALDANELVREDAPGYDPDVDDATTSLLVTTVTAKIRRILATPAHTQAGHQVRAAAALYEVRDRLAGGDPGQNATLVGALAAALGHMAVLGTDTNW